MRHDIVAYQCGEWSAEAIPVKKNNTKQLLQTEEEKRMKKGILYVCLAVLFWQGAAFAAFIDNGNGTITDTGTGLVWQKATAPGTYTWEQALTYCENLTLGGHSDWRLPNRNELQSIVDYNRYNPAIDTTFFPGTVASSYWSSTTFAGSTGDAWYVFFNFGYVGSYYKAGNCYVRAVRGGQCGSFGDLDHFSFSQISSPQSVGVPFSVTITAMDANGNMVTNFNGGVTLSNGGSVSPMNVKFINGVWNGNVTIIEGGCNNSLIASGGGAQGTSNQFITTGQVANTGRIEGEVKDNRGNLLSGATVYLSYLAGGTTAYPTALTDSSGRYYFDISNCGYYLWATYNGSSSSTSNFVFVPEGRTLPVPPLVINIYTSATTPVILVPGFPGSTSKYHKGVYTPKLDKAYETLENLELLEVKDHPGWQKLKDYLKGVKKLDERTTIIDCPWDWRVPLDTAVKWYLKPAIEKAQNGDPNKKVNIIAHSTGGLLVRAYIQGSSYNGDIENFTMVGTPNAGTGIAYYVWEGGDPVKLDDLTNTFDLQHPIISCFRNFWWNTVRDLYEDTYKFGDLPSWQYGKIRPFIQQYVPSGRQLMPTYQFLDYKGTLKGVTTSGNVNEFLIKLNQDNKRFERMERPPSSGKVVTRVYYSSSEDTIGTIKVNMNADSFWTSGSAFYEDGRPAEDPKMQPGDGTVPDYSAELPCNEGWAEYNYVSGAHSELIRNHYEEIANDLYETPPNQSTSLVSEYKAALAPENTSQLSLNFNGRIQPSVTDSLGRIVGINLVTGAVDNTMSSATIMMNANAGSILINNPMEGTYILTLKAIYSEDCSISVTYDDSTKSTSKNFKMFSHADTRSFNFIINASSADTLVIQSTPRTPSDLRADAINSSGLKTRLVWVSSTSSDVTGYNIYSREIDAPYLSQLGNATGNSFDTGDTWAENASIKTRIYAVSAVKVDGTESFLSNMVKNDDRDHDGLTDEQETSFGTNISNPDSDSDGLTDGEEYNRGTNPLVTDTDGDGYSDSVEIQAGSDPLDPNSTSADTDNDGTIDIQDNCPSKPNGPILGSCSATSDKPGINCASDADCANGCSSNGLCIKDQRDSDSDGKGDVCDNCPTNCNSQQFDADNDGTGDVCDTAPGCGGCSQPLCEQQC